MHGLLQRADSAIVQLHDDADGRRGFDLGGLVTLSGVRHGAFLYYVRYRTENAAIIELS